MFFCVLFLDISFYYAQNALNYVLKCLELRAQMPCFVAQTIGYHNTICVKTQHNFM